MVETKHHMVLRGGIATFLSSNYAYPQQLVEATDAANMAESLSAALSIMTVGF